MNLVVWVADALRVDHLGSYGARTSPRRRSTSLRRAACGSTRRSAPRRGRPRRRRRWSPASTRTGTATSTGTPSSIPAFPTLFTVAAAYGYETGFVFDERYLFRGFADANVAGTSARLDGAVEWLRERGSAPFCLVPQLDDPHAVRRPPPSARSGGRQRRTSSRASSPATRSRWRRCTRATTRRWSASRDVLLRGVAPGARRRRLAGTDCDRFRRRPRRVVGRALRRQVGDPGRTMHGADLYDEVVRVPHPRRPGSRARRRHVAGEPRRPHADDAGLADAPIDGLDGSSLVPLARGSGEGDRPASSSARTRAPSRSSPSGSRHGRSRCTCSPARRRITSARIGELVGRPDDVPSYASGSTRSWRRCRGRALSAEDEALVEQRLSDLGYL